jgi:hypothetical protein
VTDFRVHVGEVRTGRITDTIPVTGLRWSDTLNGNGSIDSVTVAGSVVRDRDLRQKTYGGRCFLAVERDGRILQAGPIWSSTWDWETEVLTLGAAGLWSMADRRIIYDDSTYNTEGLLTFSNVTLGGLATSLVSHMVNAVPPFSNLPIVLPSVEAGSNTESFARWELSRYGEQLRQITQRATDAPDIAFRARRRGDDPRFLEWLMMVGTVGAPSLSQGGPDWVFDTTLPKSPVLGISTDEDATQMATATWATGNGSEADMKQARAFDDGTLLNAGWPFMEVDESHPTVADNVTLQGHADNLQARAGRPVEVYKVQVSADYARDVRPGDYCQVITKAPVKQADGSWTPGANWLGDMNRRMRVKTVSGDLSDVFTLDMFPLAGLL